MLVQGDQSWAHSVLYVQPRDEVDTGIEVDSLSFTSLHSEQLGCPECLETHQLSLIKVWVAEMGPPEAAE